MTKLRDLTGQRFGRLGVLSRAEDFGPNQTTWHCRCDCGSEKPVRSQDLTKGLTTSCGCVRREATQARATVHGAARPGQMTPEYLAWASMKSRCTDPTNSGYSDYGARGITVCARWLKGEGGNHPFECFLADVGPRPSAKHSIGRRENDGNYEPDNVSWETLPQQRRNTRATRYVTVRGEAVSLAEAVERFGVVNYQAVIRRLGLGWSIEQALSISNTRAAERVTVVQ